MDKREREKQIVVAIDHRTLNLDEYVVVPAFDLGAGAPVWAVLSTWDGDTKDGPHVAQVFATIDEAQIFRAASDYIKRLELEIDRLRARVGEPSIADVIADLKATHGADKRPTFGEWVTRDHAVTDARKIAWRAQMDERERLAASDRAEVIRTMRAHMPEAVAKAADKVAEALARAIDEANARGDDSLRTDDIEASLSQAIKTIAESERDDRVPESMLRAFKPKTVH